MKIQKTAEITSKIFAEMFCEMDSDKQAAILSDIAVIFHSWGNFSKDIQIHWIVNSKKFKYAKPFILEIFEEIQKQAE